MNEGYTKYIAEHTMAPAFDFPGLTVLDNARTRLHKLGLVGEIPDGPGYGNLSIRYKENEFFISGTATGAIPVLGNDYYCLVSSFDLEKNQVITSGPVQASSESMTHGAVFMSCPGVHCVIHIHSMAIFDGMIKDNYPSTPEYALFGTPEIALAIAKCVDDIKRDEGTIVMAGHEEGVVIYGQTVERALQLTLELNNKYGRA